MKIHPILVLSFLACGACGGSVADGIDAGGDAAADQVIQDAPLDMTPIFDCPATKPGSQIYGLCLVSIDIADKGGGFGPQPPAGSDCAPGAQRHQVQLATGVAQEEHCLQAGPNQPYKNQLSNRTITKKELDDVIAALKAAHVVSPGGCGADKSLVQLTVSSNATKTVTYTDSFYSCQGTGPYADGLDAVLAAFLQPK